MKTIEKWIKELPDGRFKKKMWDALIDRLQVRADSMKQVADVAYLVRGYEEDCPYFFGASLYFDGVTPRLGKNSMAEDGYNDAKEAMQPSEG
jgi:hypothetical protein